MAYDKGFILAIQGFLKYKRFHLKPVSSHRCERAHIVFHTACRIATLFIHLSTL